MSDVNKFFNKSIQEIIAEAKQLKEVQERLYAKILQDAMEKIKAEQEKYK